MLHEIRQYVAANLDGLFRGQLDHQRDCSSGAFLPDDPSCGLHIAYVKTADAKRAEIERASQMKFLCPGYHKHVRGNPRTEVDCPICRARGERE